MILNKLKEMYDYSIEIKDALTLRQIGDYCWNRSTKEEWIELMLKSWERSGELGNKEAWYRLYHYHLYISKNSELSSMYKNLSGYTSVPTPHQFMTPGFEGNPSTATLVSYLNTISPRQKDKCNIL